MKISLNSIKQYVNIPQEISTQELIKLIGSRLVEVEGSDDWSLKYRNIYIVKVVECEPIEGTHLHLCKIDAGHTLNGQFDAEHNDGIQVVCGAPNVHAGMLTVWIAPGAIVPATYDTDDVFEISARPLRGNMSYGMLAAADELALGDDHEGIIELDPEMEVDGAKIAPGDSFAEKFGLNDIILDIENKSLTHRPDTFGLIGFAREVAGILGISFEEPDYYDAQTEVAQGKLDIQITDTDLCPRYSCAVLDFNDTPHSKFFTTDDVFLIKAGMRPVSPIVDITNIIMLKTGQPLHAFDYDKFVKVGNTELPKIIVRAAEDKEKLVLLDGKTIECNPNDILITSNNVPVALAGAMGGQNTEIDEHTTRIILESATFSLYHLRKTQMAHGIFSEAITRFTKGQPAAQTMPVLLHTIKTIGGEPLDVEDCYPSKSVVPEIVLSADDINSLLGTQYPVDLIVRTLQNVGFNITVDKDSLSVISPEWRTDIHIKEDIIEEVGRLLGYDNIELDFPKRPFIGASVDELFALKNRIRDILSDKLNAHEVLTYSFVSKQLQELVGEKPEHSYEIVNSISPELQCFRQSIVPSILEKVRDNLKAGYTDFALYEINQVASKVDGLTDENVPTMHNHLAMVAVGNFYDVKARINILFKQLGFKNVEIQPFVGGSAYYESLHAASLKYGHFGEIKAGVLKRLKIAQTVSAFEIDLDMLLADIPEISAASFETSRFPSVARDITIKVSRETSFANVQNAIEQVLAQKSLIARVEAQSIYQGENNQADKNLSFKLSFASRDHTLSGAEISDIMNDIESTVTQELSAQII